MNRGESGGVGANLFEGHLCTEGSYLSKGMGNQCRRGRIFTVDRYLQEKSVKGPDHINIISMA